MMVPAPAGLGNRGGTHAPTSLCYRASRRVEESGMSGDDLRLVGAALAGIALSIVLITKGKLHPFVGLLCGALRVGPWAGMSMGDTAKSVEEGAGSILGGTGLVVALGLSLGAMLQISNGASGLA